MVRVANQDGVAAGVRQVCRPLCSFKNRNICEALGLRRLPNRGNLPLAEIRGVPWIRLPTDRDALTEAIESAVASAMS